MSVQVESPVVNLTYTNVLVSNATTALAAENSKRKYLAIINRSTERVDIKSGAAAVSGEGIPLNGTTDGKVQGAYEFSISDGNLTFAAVNGICASGQKTVTVVEGTATFEE